MAGDQGLIVVLGQLAPAMQKQFEAIAQYNSTLAFFEWTKGTILHYNNVSIAEGDLPECVRQKALERLRYSH